MHSPTSDTHSSCRSSKISKGCPACDRFFGTQQGLNLHLKTAKSCKWYRKGKLRDLSIIHTAEPHLRDLRSQSPSGLAEDGPIDWSEPGIYNDIQAPYSDLECGDDEIPSSPLQDQDEFQLIPDGCSGPGPQSTNGRGNLQMRSLDDDDDSRVVEMHPTAGKILPPLPSEQQEKDSDGDIHMEDGQASGSFSPFSSELDWKIAEWAVKDNVGHSSLDRLLGIPGVRSLIISSYFWIFIVLGCRKTRPVITQHARSTQDS
jgi:hypothetical protein